MVKQRVDESERTIKKCGRYESTGDITHTGGGQGKNKNHLTAAAFFRDALSIHIVGRYIAWLKSLREYIMFILYLCARIFAYVRMRLRLLRFFSNFSCPFFTHTYIHTFIYTYTTAYVKAHTSIFCASFPHIVFCLKCVCARVRERERIYCLNKRQQFR